MGTNPKRAIIYIASGEQYIDEAARSASSVGAWCHYPRVLCTPDPLEGIEASDFESVFTLSPREGAWYPDSTRYFNEILGLGYDEYLYLDTDTWVCGPLEPYFEALARFDIVGTHAIGRETVKPYNPIPESFPELHIGAMAFKNNLETQYTFAEWQRVIETYPDTYQDNDQGALRQALWETGDTRLGYLPPEYCFRFRWGGLIGSQVRVLHGREYSRAGYEEIETQVNGQQDRIRVWVRRELA